MIWKQPTAFFIFYIILDTILSITFLGFYQKELAFNKKILNEQLFLKNGYNFTSNGLDFVLLSLLRSIFIILCYISIVLRVNQQYSIIFLGLFICNCSFSLIKLLAFSETMNFLTFFGVWFSLIWNIISFGLIYLSWKWFFERKIEVITNSLSSNTNSTYERLNHTTELNTNKRSTFSHIVLLLRYCWYYYGWLIIGIFILKLSGVP